MRRPRGVRIPGECINVVPYLITALALLLVLSPVAWMMPSPQQHRQAKLREYARKLGIDVRIGELPQTRRERVRAQPVEQGAIYRIPVRDGWRQPRSYMLCRLSAAEPWEALEDSPPLAPALEAVLQQVAATVPADVVGIELAVTGPAFYWRERGKEQVDRKSVV